jgi:hypothetical protein
MSSDAFMLALLRRANAQLLPDPVPCKDCNEMVDTQLRHIGSCKKYIRHDVVRDALYTISIQSHLNPKKEEPGLLRHVDGGKKRPADILYPSLPALGSKTIAVDVTVIRRAEISKTADDSKKYQQALDHAEKEKSKKHEAQCKEAEIIFYPFAMDTDGHIGESADKVLNAIANAYSGIINTTAEAAKSFIRNRLAFAIEKAECQLCVDYLKNTGRWFDSECTDGYDYFAGEDLDDFN